MRKISFLKLQASGNDFILIDNRKYKLSSLRLKELAKKCCQRKISIGADGLLVIEHSRKAEFKMRIFNSNGSEPNMCGNGARCVGLFSELVRTKSKKVYQMAFDTKAGIIEAKVSTKLKKIDSKEIKIKTTTPYGLKLDMPITILGRKIKVNYLNTGVPHVVIFVESLENIDVDRIGRQIRFHRKFKPQGVNVNFVEILDNNYIKLRTYERGVEAETLACGTGTIASAVIYWLKTNTSNNGSAKVCAKTKSNEILGVYFSQDKKKIKDIWLEGRAYLVCEGRLYVPPR